MVTSPPYGPTVHGLVRPGEHGGVKYDDLYNDGHDRGNLAYRGLTGLANGFTRSLTGCQTGGKWLREPV